MGNTLLHFHHGENVVKDINGIRYLTEHLRKFNEDINFDDVRHGFFEKWMKGIEDRTETVVEYPIEEFLNNFLKEYKLCFNLEQCIEAINIFYSDYREQLYFEENIFETLSAIKEKGYRLGVISNTCYYDEVMKECFKKANIYDLIDSFTFSYSLRIGKPKREIFQIALKSMNIEPYEAAMVGDSLDKDIKPALEIGMKTIWLNNKNINNNSGVIPQYEIQLLADLLKYI
ncbi:HAD family hydrolase [Clostridium sp. YIM B02515]|uniref:HAD family hydrolase n=2 Tax=Clostridium rhizosphaerae TaxID=2803861 RepID=A0ABS1TH14_9CLOT|nr:HAD family hydrolase [Clostridium rhizosphaerae]